MTTVPSQRQERRALASDLRAQHKTWGEIADVFARRYDVNKRVAFRFAHDWSQSQAAEAWNERWPSDPKTFKNVSYWEQWPASTGYAPSLDVLARLAQLYHCAVPDLLTDCPDFRPADPAHQARTQLASWESQLPLGEPTTDSVRRVVEELDGTSPQKLARAVSAWMSRLDPKVGRRDLLLKVSAALTIAAATPASAAAVTEAPPEPVGLDFAGIWHSRYRYESSSRNEEHFCEHYVVFQQRGDRLIGENVPAVNDSVLKLDLTLRGTTATGTWSERTSPTGYYRGREYHGAIQLVIDPMGKEMNGLWIGVDREFNVNSDIWELQWVDAASAASRRNYHLRA